MGIDPKRLGPKAQAQILRQLGNAAQKESKMHATPLTLTMPDGSQHRFPSTHEANRYKELEAYQRAGRICGLKIQHRFELIPEQYRDDGTVERAAFYDADFVYYNIFYAKPEMDENHLVCAPGTIMVARYGEFGIKEPVLPGEVGRSGLHYGYDKRGKWCAWSLKMVVEDAKGQQSGTPYTLFKLKRKLMLHRYGIEVQEV